MLKVNDPCPMSANRMRTDTGYYCKSCKAEVIDFTDKSTEYIIEYLSKKPSCGIFTTEQVQTPSYSLKHKFLFKALTLLAFFGFNVKPLGAQNKEQLSTLSGNLQPHTINFTVPNITNTVSSDGTKVNAETKPPRKPLFRKKKKKVVKTMGCPSF